MGLLGDIYSAIDTQKRRLGGLLADPAGTLALGVTRFGEDQGGLLNTFANAYPMAGDKTVLNTPDQIEQFRREVADAAANQAMAAATVWHGSPHKFDKFDSSKIGTGEGAQAYGHGLYLAESPDTARYYQQLALRELQANPYDASVINRFMGKSATPTDNASESLGAYALADANKSPFIYNPVLAMKNLRDKARESRIPNPWLEVLGIDQVDPVVNKSNFDAARKYIRDFSDKTDGTGAVSHLYKVDLPDEHIAKMLDWDKPLSQQSDGVVNAVAKLQGVEPDVYKEMMKLSPDKFDMSGDQLHQQMFKNLRRNTLAQNGGQNLGASAYSSKVSEALREAGIPGIRYLDGGSRGAGQGTQNYVVFPGNEGLLSILERNGVPIK